MHIYRYVYICISERTLYLQLLGEFCMHLYCLKYNSNFSSKLLPQDILKLFNLVGILDASGHLFCEVNL